MNNLDRLIKAEGVQGGVLAEYEKRFRRFADVRVNSDDDAMNLSHIGSEMLKAYNFTRSQAAFDLYVLAKRAAAAHVVLRRGVAS